MIAESPFRRWLLLTPLCALWLAACASTPDMPPPSLQRVALDPQVEMPELPSVRTHGDVWGKTGTLIGKAIVFTNESSEQRFAALVAGHGIAVEQMTLDSVRTAFSRPGTLQLAPDAESAPVTLKLEVTQYGISENGNRFSGDYRAAFGLKLSLYRSGEAEPFRELKAATRKRDGDRPQVDGDLYYEDPELLRQHLQLAIDDVIAQLRRELREAS